MADRSGDDRPGAGRPDDDRPGGSPRRRAPRRPPRDAAEPAPPPSSRRAADQRASEALQRMFDGPDGASRPPRPGSTPARSRDRRAPAGTDGTTGAHHGGAGEPAAQDRVIHEAVMAGFDAFADDGRHRDGRDGGGDLPGEEQGAPGATRSSLAVALAASDEEELLAATRSRPEQGAPGSPAGHEGGDGWADRFDDEQLDEDLALTELSGPRQRFNPLAALGRSASSGLTQAGEMTWLAGTVIKSAITRPTGYWGETKEQIYSALKLCWVPMIVSVTAFGIGAPGLQGGNVFTIFGVPEREGSFIVATGIREFAPWIDAMIVAGVVGTAITADIGARRIREEIDAMEVLGVDPIRELVLPRILSTAIITGLFDIVALLVGIVGGYVASVLLLGASTAGYTSQFFSQANVPDLVGSFAKTFLFGAVVGVVCSYKGMRASGGPSGVGKAVNSAVVISFALIWTINYVFTNTLLGFAPSTQTFH